MRFSKKLDYEFKFYHITCGSFYYVCTLSFSYFYFQAFISHIIFCSFCSFIRCQTIVPSILRFFCLTSRVRYIVVHKSYNVVENFSLNYDASKVWKIYANFISSGHSICVFIQYHHIRFSIIYVLPIIVA
jgi:hypothetical protein